MLPMEQALIGPNPQAAIGVFGQGGAIIADHGRRIGNIKMLESDSVESTQAEAGSHPEIAIAGLAHGLNAILRQALFDFPIIESIMGGVGHFQRLRNPAEPEKRQQYSSDHHA